MAFFIGFAHEEPSSRFSDYPEIPGDMAWRTFGVILAYKRDRIAAEGLPDGELSRPKGDLPAQHLALAHLHVVIEVHILRQKYSFSVS